MLPQFPYHELAIKEHMLGMQLVLNEKARYLLIETLSNALNVQTKMDFPKSSFSFMKISFLLDKSAKSMTLF